MEHINNTCIRISIKIDSNMNDHMYLKVDNRANLRGRLFVVLERDRRRMFGPS